MRPTPRSTVIEFFYPQGWAFDYEYTTRALGMVHYGVWNDMYVSHLLERHMSPLTFPPHSTFTRPNVPERHNYIDGFQGNEIAIDGVVVADLVHQRLQLDQTNLDR